VPPPRSSRGTLCLAGAPSSLQFHSRSSSFCAAPVASSARGTWVTFVGRRHEQVRLRHFHERVLSRSRHGIAARAGASGGLPAASQVTTRAASVLLLERRDPYRTTNPAGVLTFVEARAPSRTRCICNNNMETSTLSRTFHGDHPYKHDRTTCPSHREAAELRRHPAI
jgi:hypothetical protein